MLKIPVRLWHDTVYTKELEQEMGFCDSCIPPVIEDGGPQGGAIRVAHQAEILKCPALHVWHGDTLCVPCPLYLAIIVSE